MLECGVNKRNGWFRIVELPNTTRYHSLNAIISWSRGHTTGDPSLGTILLQSHYSAAQIRTSFTVLSFLVEEEIVVGVEAAVALTSCTLLIRTSTPVPLTESA